MLRRASLRSTRGSTAPGTGLVLVMLGDHQPNATVSGDGANHEVPISIVARDPSVFRQIASWHWQNGLMPGPSAPLKPMSAFRNQFLSAFSTASSQTASAHGPGSTRTATGSGAAGG